jgi:hypothetical protein
LNRANSINGVTTCTESIFPRQARIVFPCESVSMMDSALILQDRLRLSCSNPVEREGDIGGFYASDVFFCCWTLCVRPSFETKPLIVRVMNR